MNMTTEKQFLPTVIELLRCLGWEVDHTFEQRQYAHRSSKGRPDIVAVRERVVWIEVKGDGGKLTPEQEYWIDLLKKARQEIYVIYPEDYYWLVEVLKRSHI